MNKSSKIYIAGHRGLVGSALMRKLRDSGYTNIIVRTHKDLDLTRQSDVETFFKKERPAFVFLAAAKVGGILANSTYKAEFIYQNIMIAANVIHASYKYGVGKLLNLGSSCIYPKFAPQPMKEEHLLTGTLEPTNEPYAIAKISAIKLCRYYNEQYGTNFISAMPANLYGPNDNFDLETSHVLPAFIRKFHIAKLLREKRYDDIIKDFNKYSSNLQTSTANLDLNLSLKSVGITSDYVTLWGSGSPYREFLYVDDLADACVFLMQRYNVDDLGELVNIGTGKDLQLKELVNLIKDVVGYKGEIKWDVSKPDGTPKKLLDVSRIDKLGWKAKIDLCKGLENVYEEYSK